ncbi:MAG TPA: ornithine carbamoyltransferase [Acidimicrobiia bacterium]|jgi:ornithine carbamoyltransferase
MNCLELDDLDPSRLALLIERAVEYKRDPTRVPRPLEGRGVALLFEKPSARTRSSSEMAVVTLGGHPIYVRGEEVGLDTRETVEDVARTFACYCSVIMARTFAHGTVERIASAVDVPVVNLLSDVAHPTQALADLLTLHEQWGSVDGRRLAYVGDGNNMVASLAFASALSGMELVVASPPGYELADTVVEAARNLGGVVELTTEPADAVDGADAIYTDVWTSMGQESEREARRAAFARYQVDAALVKAARPDAVVLHCLPAHRGEEIAAEVIDGPHSIVWQQAGNRMDALQALLVDLLGEG